jgi:hypothetical protein
MCTVHTCVIVCDRTVIDETVHQQSLISRFHFGEIRTYNALHSCIFLKHLAAFSQFFLYSMPNADIKNRQKVIWLNIMYMFLRYAPFTYVLVCVLCWYRQLRIVWVPTVMYCVGTDSYVLCGYRQLCTVWVPTVMYCVGTDSYVLCGYRQLCTVWVPTVMYCVGTDSYVLCGYRQLRIVWLPTVTCKYRYSIQRPKCNPTM